MLTKVIRTNAWIQGGKRHAEISCGNCDSNLKLIYDKKITAQCESVIQCPRCRSGILLSEEPDSELGIMSLFFEAGMRTQYAAEMRV